MKGEDTREAASERPPYPDVARLVRAARAAAKMSKGELRRRGSFNHQTLYRAERGMNRPDTLTALMLMEVLEIPAAVMRAAVEGDAPTVDDYITTTLGAEAADAARAWAEVYEERWRPPPG